MLVYNYVHKEITILRNITKLSYIPIVKSLMSNKIQTCPCVLDELRVTQSREITVIYIIEYILLSHLQLIRLLYELFLEIIKAHGTL